MSANKVYRFAFSLFFFEGRIRSPRGLEFFAQKDDKMTIWVNKSIVYPWVCEDVPYGKMSRPWPMPGPQRARPAGPEHAYPSSCAEFPFLANSYLKIVHWSIFKQEMKAMGRSWWKWLFYLKEMRFALDRYGSRGHFFFENQSLIDFQIGNERKREFREFLVENRSLVDF